MPTENECQQAQAQEKGKILIRVLTLALVFMLVLRPFQ